MLLFKTITTVFEEISEESSRTKITEKLAFLFASATADEAALLSYLSLGSLLSPYKNMVWNFGEKNILHVLSRLSNQEHSIIKTLFSKEGDLGTVAQKILTITEYPQTSISTLNEIYHALHQLALITGNGAQEKKEEFLLNLFKSEEPTTIKYIIRIISGDLRLGFSDMTLLDAFSWSIVHSKKLKKTLEHAYNVSADIGFIIKVLKNQGPAGIENITAQPGIPIRPAAAERLPDADAIIKKLHRCIAQPKLDGLRVQIHIFYEHTEKKIAIFSRNLKDMSPMFPEITELALHLFPHPCIIEGEALAFDPKTNKMLPFQITAKRRRKHSIKENISDVPLKVVLFDILYENKEILLNKIHAERRAILAKLLEKPINNQQGSSITLIEERTIQTEIELNSYFEECIEQGFEGLVVKKIDATYQPGTRNFNWVKLKRQETGSLSDTLDCVIIGYYHGQGKRAQFGIGAFLVAVYNQENKVFQTIAKIGTGLSDIEWQELKIACDSHRISHQLPLIECPSELIPDVWIAPAIVCSIRADEITKSPLHTAAKNNTEQGYALRFPRIMSYRKDKSALDATTTEEIATLYTQQKQKNNKLLGL